MNGGLIFTTGAVAAALSLAVGLNSALAANHPASGGGTVGRHVPHLAQPTAFSSLLSHFATEACIACR
jgi:uncharacterized membrane protein